MPLTRVSLLKGKPPEYRQAILDGLYQAMREAFDLNNTRGPDKKKALFARIAELLTKNPGIRPENILVKFLEVPKENWSFGNGIAQYA